MDSQLAHSKHYGAGVLLFVVVAIAAVLILWAIFRNKNDDKKHRSRSDSRVSRSDCSESRSKSHSRDCDETSESRYSDSSSASRNSSH